MSSHSFKADLILANKENKEEAIAWLSKQHPGGGTNLLAAIQTAKQNKKAQVYAILSDGYPSNDPTMIFGALEENQKANERAIAIYTVSYYASSRGNDFLKFFAAKYDGHFAKR